MHGMDDADDKNEQDTDQTDYVQCSQEEDASLLFIPSAWGKAIKQHFKISVFLNRSCL